MFRFVAGARASFKRLLGGDSFMDADAEALNEIIKKREANPSTKGPHIEFCGDVAGITPSLAYCQRRDENDKTAKDDSLLKKTRAQLEPRARPAFDGAVAAFRSFVKAESDRAYQRYVDGTIRNQASMDQEALVRRNFMARIKVLAGDPAAGPAAGPRPFAEADRELNAAYRGGRTKSRGAQHGWVRYRDAMAKLAAARWPDVHDAEELTRALVTEDRIRELRSGEEQ
jgi:hypothetical protein